MGYYNWGEQVSNSFMNMLAMNQQKKLEEKRNQFEQKRLDIAETQLGYAKQEMDSTLRANDQAYKYQQMLIDEATRKQKMDLENGGYLDLTNDKIANPKFFSALDYERYSPMSYEQVTYNTFDPNTGSAVKNTDWMRRGDMDSLLKLYADRFEQESNLYTNKKNRELEMARIGQAGYGNAIEQQKLDMLKDDTYRNNMNNSYNVLKKNMPAINELFYVKDGTLWERNPASPKTKDFWPSTSKQLGLSEHDLQSAITSVISDVARNSQPGSLLGKVNPAWMKGYDVTKGGAINLGKSFKKRQFPGNKYVTIDMSENNIYDKDIIYDSNGYAKIIDPSTKKSYFVTKNGNYKKK